MKSRLATVLYVVLVAATAAVMVEATLGTGGGGALAGASPGVRPVDRDRLLRQVQEGRLTDHEASWWQPLLPPGP